MKRNRKSRNWFVDYMRRTFMNKVVALALLGAGLLGVKIIDDGTFLMLAILFAVPLFFAPNRMVY